MEKSHMKILSIVCFVICAISLFVGIERYTTNAGNVRAMNSMGSQFSGIMGGNKMEPATPAATKYAVFFALLSGVGGAILLVKSKE